jgi:hypothetical protein
MANEKRLINAIELANFFGFMRKMWSGSEIMNVIHEAETVDAVEVKCKVGDWVYALWEAPVKQKYIIYCAEVKEIRIGMRNCRLTTTYRLEPIMYRGHIHEYRDEDFGKLVFSSEEEAKNELAKMDGDGNG